MNKRETNNGNNNEGGTMTFKGFHAQTDNGTPCYVVNEGRKDGIFTFKVRLGSMTAYYGDHTPRRDVIYGGKVGWIAQSRITRGKKR